MSMSGSPIRSSDPIEECREGLRRHTGFDDGEMFDACMGAALGESEGPSYGALAGILAAEGQIACLKGMTLFAQAVMTSIDYYYHLQPDQRQHHPAIFRFDRTCRVKRQLWSLIAGIRSSGAISDDHVKALERIQDDISGMKGMRRESDLRDILRLLRESIERDMSKYKQHMSARIDEILAAGFDSPRMEHIGREALDLLFTERVLLLEMQDAWRAFLSDDDEAAVFEGAVLLDVLPADENSGRVEDIPWIMMKSYVQTDIIEHSARLLAGGTDGAVAFVWSKLEREWAHHLAFVRKAYAQEGILTKLSALNAARVHSWAREDLYEIDNDYIDVILSAERFLGRAKGAARHLIPQLLERFELVSSTLLEGLDLFTVETNVFGNVHLKEALVLAEALCRLDPKTAGKHVRSFITRLALDGRLPIGDVSCLLARSENILGPSDLNHIGNALAEQGLTPVGQGDWDLDAVDEFNWYRYDKLRRLLKRVRDVRTGHAARLAAV